MRNTSPRIIPLVVSLLTPWLLHCNSQVSSPEASITATTSQRRARLQRSTAVTFTPR